ncbi:MAG: elongation factor P hydroxylase, partial [Candidatus Regiella insecticola]|nr:elongation factor P hydroxylase [Candidatus Regiella insecticola]
DCEPDRLAFQHRFRQQVFLYLQYGIAHHAQLFIQALQRFYQTPSLTAVHFKEERYARKI